MSLTSFFSNQARKPAGLFGRFVMSTIFDKGNVKLNAFVDELMSVQADDRILEIGFGTGKLLNRMARQVEGGSVVGVDFSDTMISIANKNNKKQVDTGKVKLLCGDFDALTFESEYFTKVCSVNTLYFWSNPENTIGKIFKILKPDGKLVLGFEDEESLKKRNLSRDVFQLYSREDVEQLLAGAGFSGNIHFESRYRGKSVLYCAVAEK